MQCDRAAELIGAYLDQELDAATRREVAAHLAACPACAALAEDLQHMGRRLAALGREPVPEHLAEDVRSRLRKAAAETARTGGPRTGAVSPSRRWLGQAAAVLLLCALSAGGAALVMSRINATTTIEREVVAAHVRSLLQDSPTQVASSDSHTVKPWFAGRLEFSPTVKDLTAKGFPLAGARLDYVGERRVAALVYHRRLHVVDVFVWPSADATDSPPRELVYRGYNLLTWRKGGSTYWAISDLSLDELRQLQTLL